MHGEYKLYHILSQSYYSRLILHGQYKNDKKHGEFKHYAKGTMGLLLSENYSEDKKQGLREQYSYGYVDRDNYKDDLLHGVCKRYIRYHALGIEYEKLTTEMSFFKGKYEGLFTRYDNNAIISSIYYFDEKPHGKALSSLKLYANKYQFEYITRYIYFWYGKSMNKNKYNRIISLLVNLLNKRLTSKDTCHIVKDYLVYSVND